MDRDKKENFRMEIVKKAWFSQQPNMLCLKVDFHLINFRKNISREMFSREMFALFNFHF